MKAVCERTCQVRIGGIVHYVEAEDVVNFEVGDLIDGAIPEYFRALGELPEVDGTIDFASVGDEELLSMDGDVDDLKAYMALEFPEFNVSKKKVWPSVVKVYLEARTGKTLNVDNTGKPPNTTINVVTQLEETGSDFGSDDDAFSDLEDLLKED